MLIIAYDGTNYHGFQVQNKTSLKTIQGTLERTLFILTKEHTNVIGSGRTDAGVHAKRQVVNFNSATRIPTEKLPLALNLLLPADIVVREAYDVSNEFHSRYSAKKKTYCYTFFNDKVMDPCWRNFAYRVPMRLDINEMKKACKEFEGQHDFRAFCASNTTVRSFIKTIDYCSIKTEDKIIIFKVTGNGFLYNMVRIMGGTLLEIGQGKRCAEDILRLLATGDRTKSGLTLPPQGLCLLAVDY
ncbi:MAG: tRNA pseudouridine(38-40) synthase TruA [Clostridia bacterium]|nr:tRNA pseudouridine(38-40) synthase TruA [Clostridia bacterium]